ncbi:hypothetical protein EVAR_66712_1 [Eumeta japonica]|uniref:Integrase catalytic domain-containing protein n=1 Tax=Eumeta variegata TaxID=151549 RepID=A0A4C1ZR25_EUMVA|nr:hypothetical protein EVAR_66712_1 [Eumeta japonica]
MLRQKDMLCYSTESHSSGNSITRYECRDHGSEKNDRSTQLSDRNLLRQRDQLTRLRSFMGDAWERLIRNVKNSLNTVLLRKNPTEEVLNTLLAEVEYAVNNRPLTHITADPEAPKA